MSGNLALQTRASPVKKLPRVRNIAPIRRELRLRSEPATEAAQKTYGKIATIGSKCPGGAGSSVKRRNRNQRHKKIKPRVNKKSLKEPVGRTS